MSGGSLVANLRWELLRLWRSQRIFLLLIPPIAGPVGSAIAFLYLHVASQGIALLLGLFVTGGLGGMIVIDYSALTLGEELVRRAELTEFTLPQSRGSLLAGRLVVVFGTSLGSFGVGAAGVWALAGVFAPGSSSTVLFVPSHLLEALFLLLFFLGAITLCASTITRSASESLVAGILGGVLTAGLAFYFVYERTITMWYPAALGVAGAVALALAWVRYDALDA